MRIIDIQAVHHAKVIEPAVDVLKKVVRRHRAVIKQLDENRIAMARGGRDVEFHLDERIAKRARRSGKRGQEDRRDSQRKRPNAAEAT
jgi:hypothetical protein